MKLTLKVVNAAGAILAQTGAEDEVFSSTGPVLRG